MKKNLKYFIEAIFVYSSFIIARFLGLSLSRNIFSFIFRMFGPLIRSNIIIKKNLLNLSNDLSDQKRHNIISSVWANYGMTFVEYIFLNRFRKNNSHIKIQGEEILYDLIASKKPAIFISGHFANFELMSMELTKKKINLATIYRPLNNFFINPFMEYLRKKYVCKNQIEKGLAGVKKIVRYINVNHSIALMIDQRVSEGEKIKFFNKEAYTTTLPAQLAIKHNLKIIPIFIERDLNNLFKMKIYDPIDPSIYQNKFNLSKKLNQILEEMIIKNPNQWIWTHDRWK
jgi:KDO2-lipid IV(A) lauroyltransferase